MRTVCGRVVWKLWRTVKYYFDNVDSCEMSTFGVFTWPLIARLLKRL